MVKKLLAMVLGVTMLIGATGCSAVDTGSGTGTSDTKSDTQVSVIKRQQIGPSQLL